jgi:predicted RNA-binding protein
MCESTVLLKGDNGLSTVMVDAVRVSVDSARCVCTDVIGRSAALDGVRVSEIDLMRHRVILERA